MDIKGSNLLTGFKKEEEAHVRRLSRLGILNLILVAASSKIYLVDYGLVHRRNDEKKYKEDPRKAHDGTIEFTSIDAHKGVGQFCQCDCEFSMYFPYRTGATWGLGDSGIRRAAVAVRSIAVGRLSSESCSRKRSED